MIDTLLIIVLVVVVFLLIYVAIKPDQFEIQRKLSINALPERLFPLINDFHNMNTWSAWETVDPEMKRSFSGESSGLGAQYAWEGNKQIGQGSMEIIESIPPSKVAFSLDFIKPFVGHNIVEFTLDPVGENTIVTQTMRGRNAYLPKLMCLIFFNQDKMIGGMFEKGLNNLKEIAEQSGSE